MKKIFWIGMMMGLAVIAQAQTQANPPVSPVSDSALSKFFFSGGPLVWFVLLPMSLVTVSLIVQFGLTIRRGKLLPVETAGQIRQLLQDRQYAAAGELAENQDSLIARLVAAALRERTAGREAMELGVSEHLEQETTELLRRLEWLNILGNVGPMVGLFGTVWGMIDTFTAIVRAGGQPQVGALANGISTALVTTWWGLVIAIPALAAFGLLRNQIDRIGAEAAVTCEEFIHQMVRKTAEGKKA